MISAVPSLSRSTRYFYTKVTTWSYDKSPKSGRYCRSDLGLVLLFGAKHS